LNKKAVAVLVLVLAIGAVVAVYLIGELKPERPASIAGRLDVPPYESSIDIPVSLAVSRIREALEESAPKSLNGTFSVNLPGNFHGEHLDWRASRGDIQLSEQNGGLVMATSVSGKATLYWETCPGGRMLPCTDSSQTVNLGANISVRVSDIRLNRGWTLSANVVPKVDVTQAEGRVFNLVRVTFESDLEDAINKALPKLQQTFGDILSQLKIRERLETVWGETNHILKVSDDPGVWVVLKPIAVAVAPVTIGDGQVTTAARLVANVSTSIGSEPHDPKAPFPDLVDMPGSPPAFEIHVPLVASLDSLATQTRKCCLPVTIPIGSKSLTLKDLDLDENRNHLLVGAKFSTGWFGAHGTLYFEGKPRLSEDASTLAIENLSYDLRTQRALLDGAAELAQPAVLEAISQKLRMDLRPLYESALTQIRARSENLVVANGVAIKNKVESVALDRVVVGDGKLVIVVAAKGTVRVEAK